ncbi:prepilin-type N-terminal cleavage/methylation domain-containing protein [Halanaerobium saccharolyticum]|uniref:Prepilin-type N-terminal cleavage/methylation domain-containing protein n=1 Tax=Halanaerobium saccharolyticum TaxID=43595 RepID=A0A4R6LUG1_9FIRM|nr:prepilin-type N-terminal cleavage/methylation domain-containing protein [Halanaerobium saccharolyticum]TDO92274.1 prepilin-type N-terminal cleavage/methylation domain-containing protein [Halanaerobium saccharolyticum]
MKNNRGFTLIEVLLVITIMGILFTVSYRPQLKNNFQIEQEIECLAADLRWARNKAILDSQTYIFRIYTVKENSGDNKIPYYFYIKEAGQKIIKRKGYYSSSLILYKTLSFKIVDDEYYEWIRFNNTATARGGTVALAEAQVGAKKYSITVNQLGRVRIEK